MRPQNTTAPISPTIAAVPRPEKEVAALTTFVGGVVSLSTSSVLELAEAVIVLLELPVVMVVIVVFVAKPVAVEVGMPVCMYKLRCLAIFLIILTKNYIQCLNFPFPHL